MKKVPTATCALRDRNVVSIERVNTPSTFYMKSAVVPNSFANKSIQIIVWNFVNHQKCIKNITIFLNFKLYFYQNEVPCYTACVMKTVLLVYTILCTLSITPNYTFNQGNCFHETRSLYIGRTFSWDPSRQFQTP